jgi:hypothetical protein
VPLEFAKGDTSFNPQPTARNLNKPALMLRVGQNGEGDTQDFAIVLAAVLGFWTVLTLLIADVFDQGARSRLPRSLTRVNWLGGVRGRTARKAVWF